MISAIALNMAGESPLEDITLFIQEIADQISNDLTAMDEKNRTDLYICDDAISTLNGEIREHKSAIATLT